MTAFLLVILAVVGLDQASKLWIVHHFSLYDSQVVIPGFFNLTYLTNNGAAFSILAGQPALWRQTFFIGAASVALVLILIARRGYASQSGWYNLALALIAGLLVLAWRWREQRPVFACGVLLFFAGREALHLWPGLNPDDRRAGQAISVR